MREEKQLLLDEIKDKIAGAETLLVTKHQGVGANAANTFRSKLRESGGELEVVRKRVFVKAAEAAGITVDVTELDGHIALVTSDGDSVTTTKTVFEFSKENGAAVEVLFGHLDGKRYTAEQVEKLSKLPDMDTMRAQFIGLLEAPMAQTLSVMQALLTSVLHCLENKAKLG